MVCAGCSLAGSQPLLCHSLTTSVIINRPYDFTGLLINL